MTAKSCTLQAAVVMIAIAFVRGAKEDVFVSRNMRQAHHFRRLGTLPAALLVSKKSAVCVCVCVCVCTRGWAGALPERGAGAVGGCSLRFAARARQYRKECEVVHLCVQPSQAARLCCASPPLSLTPWPPRTAITTRYAVRRPSPSAARASRRRASRRGDARTCTCAPPVPPLPPRRCSPCRRSRRARRTLTGMWRSPELHAVRRGRGWERGGAQVQRPPPPPPQPFPSAAPRHPNPPTPRRERLAPSHRRCTCAGKGSAPTHAASRRVGPQEHPPLPPAALTRPSALPCVQILGVQRGCRDVDVRPGPTRRTEPPAGASATLAQAEAGATLAQAEAEEPPGRAPSLRRKRRGWADRAAARRRSPRSAPLAAPGACYRAAGPCVGVDALGAEVGRC